LRRLYRHPHIGRKERISPHQLQDGYQRMKSHRLDKPLRTDRILYIGFCES
jgi:hypothetical protein